MSRSSSRHLEAPAGPDPADDRASFNAVQIAEQIGMDALDMSQKAHAAGFTTLCFLLESVALEAGAQVAALQWPQDASER